MKALVTSFIFALAPARFKEAEAIIRTIQCTDTIGIVKKKTKRLGRPSSNIESSDGHMISWYFGVCPDGVLAAEGCEGAVTIYFHGERLFFASVKRVKVDTWGERTYNVTASTGSCF